MNMQESQLPIELFNKIGTNDKLIHEITFSHKCCDSLGHFKHFQAIYYPHRYIVTPEQIEVAKTHYNRRKDEIITQANAENTLLFVGMGMNYEPRFEDDVCNHRIRTFIKNSEGKRYFIEFCSGRGESFVITYMIDEDLRVIREQEQKQAYSEIMEQGGFMRISHSSPLSKRYKEAQRQDYYMHPYTQIGTALYTKQNIINYVNKHLKCNFKSMKVASYFITQEDYTSISPKL